LWQSFPNLLKDGQSAVARIKNADRYAVVHRMPLKIKKGCLPVFRGQTSLYIIKPMNDVCSVDGRTIHWQLFFFYLSPSFSFTNGVASTVEEPT
jgi:hypothetical protein